MSAISLCWGIYGQGKYARLCIKAKRCARWLDLQHIRHSGCAIKASAYLCGPEFDSFVEAV